MSVSLLFTLSSSGRVSENQLTSWHNLHFWHPGMRSGRELFYPNHIQVKTGIMMIEPTPPCPTPVIHFFRRQTFSVFESRNIQRSCQESTMLVSLPPGEKKNLRKDVKSQTSNQKPNCSLASSQSSLSETLPKNKVQSGRFPSSCCGLVLSWSTMKTLLPPPNFPLVFFVCQLLSFRLRFTT